MSRKHSFKITLSNNRTEKEGIQYLLTNHSGFFQVDLGTKKELLSIFDLEKGFLQSFDLIYIPDLENVLISEETVQTYIEDILLIELKTTQKYLPENPKGFFFGATENEFNLGRRLGEKFRFCFVCLNENSRSYAMLTVDELEQLIRNKRVQFQINL